MKNREESLSKLNKQLHIHRLQFAHHDKMQRLHNDHLNTLLSLRVTHNLAHSFIEPQKKKVLYHRKMMAVHQSHVTRLRDRLRQLNRKAPTKSKKRKFKVKSVNQSGSWQRQTGTQFAAKWEMDFNKGNRRLTKQMVSPDYLQKPLVQQLNRRLQRSQTSPTVQHALKKIFRIGTLTNLPPDTGEMQFGVPRSTI